MPGVQVLLICDIRPTEYIHNVILETFTSFDKLYTEMLRLYIGVLESQMPIFSLVIVGTSKFPDSDRTMKCLREVVRLRLKYTSATYVILALLLVNTGLVFLPRLEYSLANNSPSRLPSSHPVAVPAS